MSESEHNHFERPERKLQWGFWYMWIRYLLGKQFSWLGKHIGRHPLWGIGAGILFTLLTGSVLFIVGMEIETDPRLWIPEKTQGFHDMTRMAELFGGQSAARVENSLTSLVFVSKGNILAPGELNAVWDVHTELLSFKGKNTQGPLWDLACDKAFPGAVCTMYTFFTFLNVTSARQLTDPALYSPASWRRIPPNFVSGTQFAANGSAISAKAMKLIYVGANTLLGLEDIREWEKKANDILRAAVPTLAAKGIDLFFFNEDLMIKETNKLVENEYPLIGGTIVLILVYMCYSLGQRPLLVKSRMLLGSSVVLTVLCSLISAFGLSRLFGITFTVMSPLIIFVLLGVGVDDMIIMVDAFDRTAHLSPYTPDEWKALPMEKRADVFSQRLEVAMQSAGYAISVTSITSLVAFVVASNVDMPSVSYFCEFGSVGIFAVFFLQISFFAGFLVLDETRLLSGRYDCLPCVSVGAEKLAKVHGGSSRPSGGATGTMVRTSSMINVDPALDSVSIEMDALSDSKPSEVKDEEEEDDEAAGATADLRAKTTKAAEPIQTPNLDAKELAGSSPIRALLLRGVVPVLAHPWGSLLVSMAFIVFFVVMALFALNIGTNVDLAEFFPSDSMLRRFNVAIQTHFEDRSRELYYVFPALDYSSVAVRENILLLQNVTFAEGLGLPPISFWLADMNKYVEKNGLTVTSANFHTILASFLAAAPFQYKDQTIIPATHLRDLVFTTNGELVASRFSFQITWSSALPVRKAVMRQCRAMVSRPEFASLQGFAFNGAFPYTDRDIIMPAMIVKNLVLAATGVVAVLFFLLPTGMVILLGLCIVMIDADVIGLLAVTGSQLDITAFSTLALAIGLSVDYVVHITHQFAAAPNHWSLRDKLLDTYHKMGTSVFNGGFSTFLGVCLLVFAQSPAFQIFFKVLFGTTLFGVAHGLIFALAVLTVSSMPLSDLFGWRPSLKA